MPETTQWLSIWGPPILQVFVVLLVFAWGLPALLLQTVQPPALQRLLRNTFHFTWPANSLLVLLSLGATFVLLGSLGWKPPLIGHHKTPNLVVNLIVVGSLLLGFANIFYFRAFRLDKVTAKVGTRAMEYSHRLLTGMPKKSDDIRLAKALDSLGALGEMAAGRTAKSEILSVLAELGPDIAALSQAKDPSAPIFVDKHSRAIRRTVTSADAPARAANFSSALEALRKTYESLFDSQPTGAERVGRAIERVSKHLTIRALAEPAAGLEAALGYTARVLQDRPADLFWVGAQCVETYPIEGSMPAFRHLVTLYQRLENGSSAEGALLASEEAEAVLLGLAALLRQQGPNMSRWIDGGLAAALSPEPDLPAILEKASAYFVRTSQFSVADTLEAWRRELSAPAATDESPSAEPAPTTVHNRPWVQFQTFRGPVEMVPSK